METDAADGNPLTTRIPTAAWKAQSAFHSFQKAQQQFHQYDSFFDRQRSTLNTLFCGPKDGEHQTRRSWLCDELLWIAGRRMMCFSRDLIEEVATIRATFPYTDKFLFPEPQFVSIFKSMLKPLDSFLVQTASCHVRKLREMLDNSGSGRRFS